MGLFKRSKAPVDVEPAWEARPAVEPTLPRERADGPWDVSEREPGDDPAYVDLGALLVRGRVGMEIRLQADGKNTERITAALVVRDGEAMELRVFAGPRSGGQWDQVRGDIVSEVERLEGTCDVTDGPFGKEVQARVPIKREDGQAAVQPSRIIGIDGPRWMLRATMLGQAAIEPSDQGDLMDALRDVIVVRGGDAMAAREPLLLTPPKNAVAPAPEAGAPTEAE